MCWNVYDHLSIFGIIFQLCILRIRKLDLKIGSALTNIRVSVSDWPGWPFNSSLGLIPYDSHSVRWKEKQQQVTFMKFSEVLVHVLIHLSHPRNLGIPVLLFFPVYRWASEGQRPYMCPLKDTFALTVHLQASLGAFYFCLPPASWQEKVLAILG